MAELAFLSSVADTTEVNDENKKQYLYTPQHQKALKWIGVGIQFILWLWARSVAMEISSPTPDSRAIHLMFALASPSLYLIVAYTQRGFWSDYPRRAPLCTPIIN